VRPQLGVNVSGVVAASLSALIISPRPSKSVCRLAPTGIVVPFGCVSASAGSVTAEAATKRAKARTRIREPSQARWFTSNPA
jgi:hypothetical protein